MATLQIKYSFYGSVRVYKQAGSMSILAPYRGLLCVAYRLGPLGVGVGLTFQALTGAQVYVVDKV